MTEPNFLLQGYAVFSCIWNTLQSLNLEQAITPRLITVMAAVQSSS
jgi:hypothetical protein